MPLAAHAEMPLPFARLKSCLFVLGFATLLLPVTVSAQQTFTGGAIAVGRTQTTASSSAITISGATGTSIGSLKIVLNGLTSDGSNCSDGNCWSLLITSFYLQSPHGGPTLVLLGGVGDGIDGDDTEDSGSGLKNATITIQDGATPAPNDTAISPQGGTFTYEPTSYFVVDSQTPPLGTEADFPQLDGTATLAGKFTGIGINDGDQWTLTIKNGEGLTTPINISSWEMVVTYATTTPTSTVVSSNTNPAFTTAPSNSVTLKATISPASGPTGTVAFTDNGTTIPGCGAVLLSGGIAQCSTSTMPQGYNNIEATYSGGSGFGQSSGSLTQLIEVHPTQSSNTWCNTTSFTAPLNGTGIAYPAMIPVSGYSPGSTVGDVTIELQNVTEGAPGAGIDAQFLLVAPGGANDLDFLDSAFNTEASGAVNLFISDSATLSPNQGTPVNNDTYLPYDGEANNPDIFPASNSPIVDSNIPLVPGTINFAAPHGKTNSFTLQQAFSGAPANGDWALYATAWNGSDALTVGGWCITLDVNSGVGTTTSLSSSAQRASFNSNVTLTATVTVQGSSTPVTSGTVEFKDETTGTVLASANALNGSGVAAVTVSNLAEGDHKILASYSGTGSFNTSFATIYQRIDRATAVTAVNSNTWQFCNTGAITIPMGTSGAETPNPSNIFVTNLPGTLNTATLTLNNFSILVGDQLDNTESLVVGPTGAGLDFFSNTADGTIGDEALAGNYVFADSAGALVPSGSGNLNPGTYKPTSYVGTDNANDVFTADPGGFFTLPGTFGYSASRGTSTLTNKFGSTNPDGTWSLYFNSPNANANGTGAAGGWCLNLTENAPTVSVSKSHTGNFTQGQLSAQFAVNIDNNGTTGPTGDPTGTNPMKVTDTLNSAFTFVSGSGTNWSCSAVGQTVTCTNDSAIAQGSSYPTLTISVNVSPTASTAGPILNTVAASGAGITTAVMATDTVTIEPAAVLAVTKTHTGTFTQGSTAQWNIVVSNTAGTGSTTLGTVHVSDTLPTGYTVNNFGTTSTAAWNCSGTTTVSCATTAGFSEPGGSNFPAIQVIVNVPANSAISVTNTALAWGGGDLTHISQGTAASGTDSNVPVVQVPFGVTVNNGGGTQSTMTGTAFAIPLSVTVKDANLVVIPGYIVTFTANPGSNAQSGIFSNLTGTATVSTSVSGIANAGTFTANSKQGSYTVTATAGSASATFDLANLGKSLTTIASISSTTATIDVFGFGLTPPSGQLAFNDLTSDSSVAAPVTLNTANALTSLQPEATTGTGANTLPDWTELGDVNGDGKLDLITSLYQTDSVSVQLGNGDGTFQPATNNLISTGFGPAESHLISLRGNGVLDIVVASFNTNQIAVLLGNGNGTFQPPAFYTIGTAKNYTLSIASGDFNHDGKLDLAVANGNDDTITILLGNGAGGLTVQSPSISVGHVPDALRSGDFNGDGYTDLAVANYNDGTVTTLLNNQNGTFAKTTFSVGSGVHSGPEALAIQGSGSSLQLAVANYHDNTVSVYPSNGNGTFGTPIITGVGKGPDDVTFADFNGVEELVVSNYTDGTVDLLIPAGATYTLVGPFKVGVGPYSAAVGDIDSDGTPDVVVSNCFSNNTGALLSGTQIAVPYTGFSLTAGHSLDAVYTPDSNSNYASSTSGTVIAP